MYLVCQGSYGSPVQVGTMRGYTNDQALSILLFEKLQSHIEHLQSYMPTNTLQQQYWTDERRSKSIKGVLSANIFSKIYYLRETEAAIKLNKKHIASLLMIHTEFEAFCEAHGIDIPEVVNVHTV